MNVSAEVWDYVKDKFLGKVLEEDDDHGGGHHDEADHVYELSVNSIF